ncbi:aldo/keto reductase [Rhodospirillum rubrum]|uniref:2,5-didehydrogluconate reductase n=1 Tax=Rhodospirillum rubrum (strain ATCC 11170 / ATH 1.1.1 / DSM 467 / LMG 4362 / NCIMB 8255 / S1) TaxID=269796 RepID=Q2RXQ2_RHORT|nr:aldo/keto reductase [Rhodospirillum rubrum]ABC21093.1 2,5-didehydrogluconate reductase [Rhodospirillum rubrum ATCC 11170]AEO46761.1 2,5-didehydrogluconate reductase [Rhodospirillum rubrum F11]MBK5952640.1 aldo/keto reductase [Rhodospirillum rubrum]QXG80785.1 aldo/keto reductase [Rhodospirillum rubrum]
MHRVSANGIAIPALGFGTWQIEGDDARVAVAEALALGYRHIDTARAYGNEAQVGAGIAQSGVPRGDIFLTTKIWTSEFKPEALTAALADSLAKLGTDYVDLTLLHWPNPEVPLADSLGALAALQQEGLTLAIGVSNFPVALVEEAVAVCGRPLAVNQVEYHPFLDQSKVIEACRRHGMAVEAYSPLARGKVMEDATLRRIAEIYGRTPGQVALRWLIQQDGVIALPKAVRPEHAKANLGALDFALSQSEMAEISALARPDGRLINPSWAPAWDD